MRRIAAALVSTVVFSIVAAQPVAAESFLSQRAVAVQASLQRGIVGEINALRSRRGLPSLRRSRQLGRAAEVHSRAMAGGGFFAHESADGSAFWRRVERWYASDGFRSWEVGENLVWASPSLDAAEAVRMWMNSPSHRRILLTAKWREVGISAVRVPAAPGVYDGLPATIVTADFGVRR